MKYTIIPCIAFAALLNSCKNPADETTDAKITEKQTVATASTNATAYHFSNTSTIGFTGSKVTGSQSGGFKTFTGSFQLEEGEPVSGEFTIDMNSIYSDSEKLTGHLKNKDFFDVETHPTSEFKVTSFEKVSETLYNVSGNLTIVGQTNNITFPATVNNTPEKISLSSKFDIKRKDWGIVYPGKPDDLIRNEVILELNLEATPAQ